MLGGQPRADPKHSAVRPSLRERRRDGNCNAKALEDLAEYRVQLGK